MTTHKWIDKICCVAMVLALLITVLFLNAEALGIQAADRVMGYEERLFDAENVHTIDILIEDWDSFLTTCQSEEYSVCSVLIDGEAYTNVGIRGKGNTSLSTVSSMDSDRYSFKIEFDQYDSTKSYYGLDKLCLNNIIQDNTYMKDFLAYQMMEEFGVDAPLCSYVYITVNGEDWGLYLAVEGVEDAFLQRNYGNDYGELYKPDSMSMGGGRGNGREFNMEDIDFSQFGGFGNFGGNDALEGGATEETAPGNMEIIENPWGSSGFPGGSMPEGGMQMPGMSGEGFPGGNMPEGGMQMPGMSGEGSTDGSMSQGGMQIPEGREEFAGNKGGFFGGFGMGSSDVKLQYIDDEISSYSNIFNNAKTDVSDADANRLIASLKALSEGENIESVVDIEEVIRYFVVHNFVVNGDSYTGSMIHNYYLYEEDGQFSMIPWDYNLAYGTFQSNDAEGTVNDPIDSPVSGGSEDRPMVNWIFESEEYTELYHAYFEEFLAQFYDNGRLAELIDSTAELIAPYVEKDPTKFCTYEEFETGVAAIREFCLLRAESVSGQLNGTIPSTSEGQAADSTSLVEASGLNLSDMGTMGMGGGFGGGFAFGTIDKENATDTGNKGNGFGGNRGNRGEGSTGAADTSEEAAPEASEGTEILEGMTLPEGMTMPEGMTIPEGMTMPEGTGFSGSFGDFGTAGNSQGSTDAASFALLGGSLVCLLAGLLVAFKYRR